MNDRFEHLMYQAGMTAQGCWDEMDGYQREAVEKFAALIVRECANYLENEYGKSIITGNDAADFIRKHFGVEA